MKLQLVFVSFAFIATTSTANFDQYHKDVGFLSDIILRQKRQTFSFGGGESCEKRCEKQLEKTIQENTEFKAIDNPFSILKQGFNATGVDIICNQYLNMSDCFDKCESVNSDAQTYDIICKERKTEFVSHLPCYDGVDEDAKDRCEGKCGGIANLLGGLLVSGNPKDPKNIGAVLKSMGGMCKFLICAVDCSVEIIEKKCPNDKGAGEFFRKISMAGAKTAFSDLETLGLSLGTQLLPNECKRLVDPNAEITDDASADSREVECSEKQLEIFEMQLKVLKKTDKKLDLEMKKLEMETELMEKNMKET